MSRTYSPRQSQKRQARWQALQSHRWEQGPEERDSLRRERIARQTLIQAIERSRHLPAERQTAMSVAFAEMVLAAH